MGRVIQCDFQILDSKMNRLNKIRGEMEEYIGKVEAMKISESQGKAAEAFNCLNDEVRKNIISRIHIMSALIDYLSGVRDGFMDSEKTIQSAIERS